MCPRFTYKTEEKRLDDSHFTAISNQDFTEFSNARLTTAYSLLVSCVALPITVITPSYKGEVRNLGIKFCSAT